MISEALGVANVDPETIAYLEAHGTATSLGDPIEIQAVTRAFRESTDRKAFCAIGSVKSNFGHLDVAAGVTGLIKTVLALENRELPPTVHYERPNPKIDFASSPVYVNATLTPWPAGKLGDAPRRAGVNSFGLGGTNAHVVLEEAPAPEPALHTRPWQLLTLSARTPEALAATGERLAAHFTEAPEQDLADAAYTLAVGRHPFAVREALVSRDPADAAACLAAGDPVRILKSPAAAESWPESGRPVAFVFPGQGAQHVGMGRDLYESEAVFRDEVDRAAAFLAPRLGLDLRHILYPAAGGEEEAVRQMARTLVAQPALLVVEIALARLLATWGVKPQAMIGHSLGEYAAAVLSGVFTLEQALELVVERGRLIEQLGIGEGGKMLAVPLSEAEIAPFLVGAEVHLAAMNGPALVSVAGPAAAVADLSSRLAARASSRCPSRSPSPAIRRRPSRPSPPIASGWRRWVPRRRRSPSCRAAPASGSRRPRRSILATGRGTCVCRCASRMASSRCEASREWSSGGRPERRPVSHAALAPRLARGAAGDRRHAPDQGHQLRPRHPARRPGPALGRRSAHRLAALL